MDGDNVIMLLAVSLLAALSLRTAVKSCSTSVYAPYKALHNCFPLRFRCKFFLMSAMFCTIRVHVWYIIFGGEDRNQDDERDTRAVVGEREQESRRCTCRKISPSSKYFAELGEENTKARKIKGGVNGSTGFFPYVLSLGGLPLPAYSSVGWPTPICNGQRSYIFIHL
jgi:hypothetical protein